MLRHDIKVGMSVRINNPIRKENGISGYVKSIDTELNMVWVGIKPDKHLLCEYWELDHVIS